MSVQTARAMAMRAVHHAYCVDTGCFDGDDISNSEIDTALDVLIAAAQVEALDAVEEIADMRPRDGMIMIADDWWRKLKSGTKAALAAAKARQEVTTHDD